MSVERAMRERVFHGEKAKIYPSAIVDPEATVGEDVVVGAFCFVAKGAVIARGTRIQSHTAIWGGVSLGERVFVGPGAMFTNVRHPRAHVVRAPDWDRTLVEEGATIGAHATLVAPVRIGRFAMVGAGAVVTRDVPAHAIVAGNPARILGWACRCGETMGRDGEPPPPGAVCSTCGKAWDELR